MRPIGRPAHDERHVEPGTGAEPPRGVLVDLGVVEERVHPLGTATLEDAAALRPAPLEPDADQRGSAVSVGGLDVERAVVRWEADRDEPGADQGAQAAGDQLEQARKLDLPRERRPDLVQRLQLLRPRRRRLVQPRVLDRDRGLAGQRLHELLVVGGEGSRLLLGQVQVAEGSAAKQDWDAQEPLHRRVMRWEADRSWIVRDRLEPERARIGDQRAKDPAPAGKIPDRGHRLGVDARVDEALERRPALVDHAQRGVPRARELRRRLGQLLEQVVEGELRAQRDPGVDEFPQAGALDCPDDVRRDLIGSRRHGHSTSIDDLRSVCRQPGLAWNSWCLGQADADTLRRSGARPGAG